MALQDLTPQLRTRLSRVERAVGWFVLLAVLLLCFGFGYYLYTTAQRKGWFLEKITYETCVGSGAGLKVGDPVKLMGFDVGEITAVIPNDPYAYYNITIQFRVKVDRYRYQGYIWSDSKVKINPGDLLGNRYLEITKGAGGVPTILENTNARVIGVLRDDFVQGEQKQRLQQRKQASAAAAEREGQPPPPDSQLLAEVLAELNQDALARPEVYYTNNFEQNIFFLEPLESPAVTERLDQLVSQVEQALPGIFALTNPITTVLASSASMTSNINTLVLSAQPVASNLALLTADLRTPGTLGEWLLPTNTQQQLDIALASAHTNLASLADSLGRSLDHLAGITSNLHAQVDANTNLLKEISDAVIEADRLVQGLQRHWLLRSAFRTKTNAPAVTAPRLHSPRGGQLYD